MDPVRRAAHLTVGRAVAFANLGIVCTLVGLSFDPPLAAKTGGILCLLTALVLLLHWYRAPGCDHRRTEVWLVLDENDRPPPAFAQRLTASALREVYHLFALRMAGASIVLFLLALLLAATLPSGSSTLRLAAAEASASSPTTTALTHRPL